MNEQERALAVLREAGEPQRLADVADALGKSPAATYELLRKLVRKGRATRVAHGRYTALAKPVREDALPVFREQDGRGVGWLEEHVDDVAKALVAAKGPLTMAAAELRVPRATLARFVEETEAGAGLFSEVNAAMADAVRYQALDRALSPNDGATLRQILRNAEMAARRNHAREVPHSTVALTVNTPWGGLDTEPVEFEMPTEQAEKLPREIVIEGPSHGFDGSSGQGKGVNRGP